MATTASQKTDASRVDRHQLRTMLRFSIKRAWRGTTNPFDSMHNRKTRIPGLVFVIILNVFFSIIFGMAIDILGDLFSGLVIAGIGAMAIVSLQVLLEYSHIIITPDDYHIVSPHPVSSKTFYLAKLAHFLLFVAVLSLTVSVIPAVIAAVTLESFVAAPIVLVHFLVSNTFAAMLMVTVFTLAIRLFKRRTMERILGYVQVAFLMSMYLGYVVAASEVRNVLRGVDVSMNWSYMISPTYWFAAPLRLIRDGWDTNAAVLLGVGILGLLVLGRLVVGRLSLTYAESLSDARDEVVVVKRRRRLPVISSLWRWYSHPEDRAVLSLLRAQFKHDMRFRMGVIWVVPYVFVIMFYESWKGQVVLDPFAIPPDFEGDVGMLMPIAIALLPFVLHAACRSSKFWQAAWVYHATPGDPVRLVLAAKRLITVLFILPFSLLFLGIYYYYFGDALHAALHTIFLVTVALIGLTLLNLVSTGLPFSEDNPYGRFSATMASMIPVMLVTMVPLAVVSHVGYAGYVGWAIVMVLAVVVNLTMVTFQNRRIREQAREWEFTA